MAEDETVPAYLKGLMLSSNQNEDEIWDQISDDFEEYLDTILNLRPQTTTEAWGNLNLDKNGEKSWTKARLEWKVPKFGGSVRPWLEIPYTNDEDFANWKELLCLQKELAEKLQPMIEAKSASIEFASLWGAFCGIYGQFLFGWNNRPVDIGRLKGQLKTHFQGQRE